MRIAFRVSLIGVGASVAALVGIYLYLMIFGWGLGLEVSGLDEDGPRWPLDVVGIAIVVGLGSVVTTIVTGLAVLFRGRPAEPDHE